MEKDHSHLVESQFSPRARDYLESAVHARGEDLEALARILQRARPERSLDLGCGAGHVSYLMAQSSEAVMAYDLSQSMLDAVTAAALARGFANIGTMRGRAEALPFDSGHFDFLASRYSAHHWSDFYAGLREARRVLRQGAKAIFIDSYAPGRPLLDTHLQVIETLRDTSHVRDYSMAQWVEALAQSGLQTLSIQTWRVRIEFESWTARIGTPELNKTMLLGIQAGAATEAKRHFAIEADGSFMLDVGMLEAEAR